jgi:hypothetical protein
MSLSKPVSVLDASDVNLDQLDKPIKISSSWKVYLESKTKSRKSNKSTQVTFARLGQHITSLEFYDPLLASDDSDGMEEVLVWETDNSGGKVATHWSKVLVVSNKQSQRLFHICKKRTSNVLQHGSKCHLVFHFVSPCLRFVLLRCGYMWLQTLL